MNPQSTLGTAPAVPTASVTSPINLGHSHMSVRSLIPALLAALACLASAQATALAAEVQAEPAAAASAVPPATAVASAASAAAKTAAVPVQRCHKEYLTGSNLPKTVCETEIPSDLEENRQRALDDLRHTVTPTSRGVGS